MARIALAVDLGGTKVDAALVEESGRVLDAGRSRRPTGQRITPDQLREAVREVVGHALEALPGG
ncbi:MAG: ROK family protein, partial [Microbacterium sp.]